MAALAQVAPSRTLTFDSQLMEDFLHTDEILVDASSARPLAVFLNNLGESEALVISKNSQSRDELYHICRDPLSDSGWNVYGMGAQPCAIAVASSSTVWAIGTDQQIWCNQTGRWSQCVAQLPGGATLPPLNFPNLYAPLSVGTDGTVWVIDAKGNLYEYDADGNNGDGEWQPVAGAPQLSTAPAGSAENLWAITTASEVVQYSGGSWQPTPWSAGPPSQLSVGTDGSVFALDAQGQLYQYANQQWQQATGTTNLFMFAIVAANNIWAIGMEGATWSVVRYDGVSWQPVSQAPAIGQIVVPSILPQLSAAGDGTIWCVDANGVSWKCLASGGASWQRQMMPTGMSGFTAAGNVSEVVVGQASSESQAFYIAGGTLNWASLTAGGTWRSTQTAITTGCSGLGITNQQDTGGSIVYGVTANGDMFVVTFSGDTSNPPVIVNANGILKGAKLQVNAMTADAWFTAAVIGGHLCVQWGNATNPLAYGPYPGLMYQVTRQPNGNSAPANLAELVPLPWVQTAAGFYCAAVDTSGNIFMVFNISVDVSNSGVGSFIPLTGNQAPIPSSLAAVKSTGALIDAGGWTRIYATDANDNLWVIRQTAAGGDANNPWSWTSWHPLGDNYISLANGPGASRTRELFTLDANGFLHHLRQDAVSLIWTATQLRKPSGTTDDPYYVSQYVTEITVYDAIGNPEPNVPVTVSVAEPISVWVTGVQYNLDATHTATLVSNAMGKVTLSTVAMGLHTAQLTFQADGFANAYSVYPPQNVQNRLAAVNGPTLQNAQARTQSVPTEVTTPLVASSQQSNCGTAATMIQNVFTIKSQYSIQPGAVTGVSPGQYTPDYQAVRALWSAKVVDVRPLPAAGALQAPGSFDSFWNDLAQFGEDIWHGIRKGILVVEGIAVTVGKELGQGVIELTLSLAELGKAIISFVIKTIDDVVNAVASAFCWLGAKIESAIDWLKEFFSWGDILNTKTVIEYYLNQVFGNLIENVDPSSPNNVQQLVQAQFQTLITMITGDPKQPGSDVFSQAQTTFGSNSFNGAVSGYPVDPKIGSNALQPVGVQSTYGAHQVKCNYARTKTETYVQRGGKVTPSGGGAGMAVETGSFEDFLSLITSQLDLNNPNSQYCVAQAALQTNLQGIKSPQDLFGTAISDFLAMVKDFAVTVIELVEKIVTAVLNLAGQSLAGFQGMLNHVLHIPVISWLWEKISGHPLTLMDVLCLVMAVPATLMYKLIWGGASASPPFTAAQVSTITSQPIPWPQIQGSNVGMSLSHGALLNAEQATDLTIILGILSLLNSLPYGFIDMGTDADALGPGEVALPTWLSAMSIFLSFAGFAYGIPRVVRQNEQPQDWKTADRLRVALWGLNGLSALFNLVWFFASKTERIAKYQKVAGPVIVAVLGAAQLGCGIAAAVEFSKSGSGYNAIDSMSAIITPIPSVAKLLLLPQSEELMLVLGPLDLICDFGSGICSFVSGIS